MKIDQNYFKINETSSLDINSTLGKNEIILWKSKPKKISYAMQKCAAFFPFALLWGLFDVGCIFLIFSTGQKSMSILLFIIPFFAIHLAPVWIFIAQLVKGFNELKYNKYYITNKRVINQTGKLGRVIDEVKLEDLKSVNLKRSFWDKLFRVGDIYLTGSKSSTVLFDIHDSEMVYSKLNDIAIMATKEAKNKTFYENNTVCEYCDSCYDKKLNNCPICGAKNPRKD